MPGIVAHVGTSLREICYVSKPSKAIKPIGPLHFLSRQPTPVYTARPRIRD